MATPLSKNRPYIKCICLLTISRIFSLSVTGDDPARAAIRFPILTAILSLRFLIIAFTFLETSSGNAPVCRVAGNPLIPFFPFLPLRFGLTTSSSGALSPVNPTTAMFLFLASCDTLSDLASAISPAAFSSAITLALTGADPLALSSNLGRSKGGI